jgi:SAM-dependent methyltransferase
MSSDGRAAADFLDGAIRLMGGGGVEDRKRIVVLDFGCGAGGLVGEMLARGYDAYGCDVHGTWTAAAVVAPERIRFIQTQPYRLPYDDNSFDVVTSTSVLEHAQNKVECLREIHRVLKPLGYAMHLLPSKWYLPSEPHIFVPLANFLWPNVPLWWLKLWAWLGVRNSYQVGIPWRRVAELNHEYCQRGISYWTLGQLRRSSLEVFGNFHLATDYYVERADGRAAALCRKLPFKRVTGWLLSRTREMFIVSQKKQQVA